MIYRNWSLLSSTVVIWGGVATAGLAGIFLLGGKVLPSVPIPGSRARPTPSVHGACFGCSVGLMMYDAWIWLMHSWGMWLMSHSNMDT
jgi:hypothetical protein